MNIGNSIATVCLNPSIDRSISIPGFTVGEVNRVEWEQDDPGGKAVNVATVLAGLGHTVTVTGFVGADAWDTYARLFNARGIENRFLQINQRTRANIKIIDELHHRVTDVNFPGFKITDSDLEELQAVIDQLAQTCDWFVFSGSLPEGAPDDTYACLIKRLTNKVTLVDTSGAALKRAVETRPYGIKPNLKELESLCGVQLGSTVKVLKQAQALIRRGLSGVAVSMGAQGALFVDKGQAVLAVPPQVQVRSTVGAGDALMAGWVSAMSRGMDLVETARFATALSVCSLQRIGRFLPDPAEIESIAREVVIQKP